MNMPLFSFLDGFPLAAPAHGFEPATPRRT